MRICYKCKENKNLDQFSIDKKRKEGRSYICLECTKVYNKLRYYRDPSVKDRRIAAKLVEKQNARDFIYSYLREHPCVDCGESRIIVLEFDHVRGEKEFGITVAIQRGYTISKIQKEIIKCDVRCANCHRIKTAHQLGWRKATLEEPTIDLVLSTNSKELFPDQKN